MPFQLQQHEIESIVRTAVHETLQTLGIDAKDPFAMQRDMAHLRFWRKVFEGAVGKILMVGLLLVFAIGAGSATVIVATRLPAGVSTVVPAK